MNIKKIMVKAYPISSHLFRSERKDVNRWNCLVYYAFMINGSDILRNFSFNEQFHKQ